MVRGGLIMTEENPPKKSKKIGQIVETSETLFMRYGLKRVTVEEICQKANVSKMTFYKYFSNKIELVKHIWNNWLDEGYNMADKIDAMDIPFTEKVRMILEWKMDFLSRMSPEFIEEFIHFDPALKEFMEELYRKSYERFLRLVAEWQKKGDIRSEIRPEFLLAVFDKLEEMVRDDNLRKLYPNHVEFIRELNSFIFYGILPRAGSESH